MNYNVALPFFESAQKYPDRLALYADGVNTSYRQLLDQVVRVAGWLGGGDEGSPRRIGILGSRSAGACIGILAAGWVGAAYIPISLKQPELAIAGLLKRSGLGALIADRTGSQMLTPSVLEQAPEKILVIGGDRRSTPPKPIAYFEELPPAAQATEPTVIDADAVAYILYTSGSTGTPKGVMLPSQGIHHLLNVMQANYPLWQEDRMAETTETSFDLTVYNMFATWRAGASLHVIPTAQAAAPAKFIQDHQITSWLSVPSIAVFMSRMGLLKPGAFPSLKYTFFAGEPLLTSIAEAWQVAAPNSVVANLYGPTEATVVCIGQQYGPGSVSTRDAVAIGRPFPGIEAAIAVGEKEFAPPGTQGELLLAGPQLALGYLDDPQKTATRFVTMGENRWYRTGDLAYCDELGIFHYLGRVDNQVKILGYRVELEEIECHLRDASGCADVAAVAWPIQKGIASGVVGFLVNFDGSTEEVKAALAQRVPAYMVPTRMRVLSKLPLNNNGKVDRQALARMLEREPVV